MFSFKFNWIIYGLGKKNGSYALRYDSCLTIFLLIDGTDRSKISSDRYWIQFGISQYPLSFFENTPFNINNSFWENVMLLLW